MALWWRTWLYYRLGLLPNPSETQIQTQAPITSKETTLAEFKVSSNQVEHNQFVENLVAAGSNQSEAELIIAAGKTAMNRAVREYTKETGNKLSQIM